MRENVKKKDGGQTCKRIFPLHFRQESSILKAMEVNGMYQALYRKYRPQTFDDVVGQQGVTQTLKNQILNRRLSHAYLFTGTRGTGKTSCAKILAKAVNCEHPIDGNPCNCCAACKSIDSGACMDVLEIDAASNNGVDNVRSLRDDAIYTPSEVKMRVYIIDEVHMLSISAFNALLKIIEEPPEHLLFILATTELHKVPATILSRCQRFSFRRLLPEDIVDRLNYIAYREHIDLEPDGAAFLARLADGGMRDAVSLLDQCASAVNGAVTTEEICRVLGFTAARKTAELMKAIGEHNAPAALTIFSEQYAEGKDLAAMLDELCAVARDLLILRTAPKGGVNLISGICTQQELKTLLPLFSAGELLRVTSILRDAAAGFNTSANRRIDAELALLRLCEVEAKLDAQSLSARISRLENKLASGVVPAAAQTAEETPPVPAAEEAPPWDDADAPPLPDEPSEPQREVAAQSQAPSGFWQNLVERLHQTLKRSAASQFTAGEDSPVRGRLSGERLLLICRTPLAGQLVGAPENLQAIGECASALLGRRVTAHLAEPEKQRENPNFNKLLTFAKDHPDIVELK